MAKNRKLTDEEIRQLIGWRNNGWSIARCASELDIPPAPVVAALRRAGVGQEECKTRNVRSAQAARQEQLREQRARIEQKLLDTAEELLGDVRAPSTVFSFGGKDNTYNSVVLDEPTHADKQRLVAAVTSAVTSARHLSEQDGSAQIHTVNLILATASALGLDDDPE